MEITEVRIKIMEPEDDSGERLEGFCSITFDHSLVVRDLRIIKGSKGRFISMPSRKLTDKCPHCRTKNHLRANFCNDCGTRLEQDRAARDDDTGKAKLYADIAHPINSGFRDQIHSVVIPAFLEEMRKSRQAGYICTYDDYTKVASLPVILRMTTHTQETTAQSSQPAEQVGAGITAAQGATAG